MKKNKLQKNRGFTLIEIMVATTIFMLVMVVGMGALLSSSNSAKKAKALSSAMDNVNFAMENISRSLRLGSNYYCTSYGGFSLPASSLGDCVGGGEAIVFTPATYSSSNTAFRLSSLNSYGKKSLEKVFWDGSSTHVTNLTSTEVNITELKFVVRGSDLVDKIQPNVYITIKGVVTIRGNDTDFAIQTLVSQRNAE